MPKTNAAKYAATAAISNRDEPRRSNAASTGAVAGGTQKAVSSWRLSMALQHLGITCVTVTYFAFASQRLELEDGCPVSRRGQPARLPEESLPGLAFEYPSGAEE